MRGCASNMAPAAVEHYCSQKR